MKNLLGQVEWESYTLSYALTSIQLKMPMGEISG